MASTTAMSVLCWFPGRLFSVIERCRFPWRHLHLVDGLNYNLAYVPPSFELEPQEAFDQVYMRALFGVGYRMARDGFPGEHAP